MADPLRPVELFGGAAEIAIPERLQDVSAFRPVPNNQEVGKYTLEYSFLSPNKSDMWSMTRRYIRMQTVTSL